MQNLLLYIDYPSWIQPEIFPGLPILGLIRWYGLMYVVGFLIGWWLGRRRAVQYGWKERDIDDFVVLDHDEGVGHIRYVAAGGTVVTVDAVAIEDADHVRGTTNDCGFFGVASAG